MCGSTLKLPKTRCEGILRFNFIVTAILTLLDGSKMSSQYRHYQEISVNYPGSGD